MQELVHGGPSDSATHRLHHSRTIRALRRMRYGLAGQHEVVHRPVAADRRNDARGSGRASDSGPELLDYADAVKGFAIFREPDAQPGECRLHLRQRHILDDSGFRFGDRPAVSGGYEMGRLEGDILEPEARLRNMLQRTPRENRVDGNRTDDGPDKNGFRSLDDLISRYMSHILLRQGDCPAGGGANKDSRLARRSLASH